MQRFISCDWGTSTLRLRVIDKTKMELLGESSSSQGISRVFNLWNRSGRKKNQRFAFYLNILKGHIQKLEDRMDSSLKGVLLIISGMASSSLGMIELDYRPVPFAADGSGARCRKIKRSRVFDHEILVISGARTDDDVMRGEETLVAGCLHHKRQERYFILPGTHSKHVHVKNGEIINIRTFMTGEFFDILSNKSILSAGIQERTILNTAAEKKSFVKGVLESINPNLLHTAFFVRTNSLLNKPGKQENYFFLSGLLIGTELREIIKLGKANITLVASEKMKMFYTLALKTLELPGGGTLSIEDADKAIIKGQLAIWNHLNH
ncbi:MAG TPA: 2-dehydro-3-deoxygalactonokinase [Chitinophagaceae bacterium]|nr:2-dehydro-3-deoxygalactonokinase [Chitinophagaceae bacterium]